MKPVPLVITFYLGTPLAFNSQKRVYPLQLDSILAYVQAMKMGHVRTPGDARAASEPIALPLVQMGERKRYYAASAMIVPSNGARWGVAPVLKLPTWKSTMARAGFTDMRFRVDSQWQRAYQETYLTLATPYLEFNCLGDRDGVTDLLSAFLEYSRHLGAKRHTGYGYVTKIEITETDEDLSVWADGMPRRPIPVSEVGERDLPRDFVAYTFPYDDPGSRAMCYIPPESQWKGNMYSEILSAMDMEVESW